MALDIKNPSFQEYTKIYSTIEENFLNQVKTSEIEISQSFEPDLEKKLWALQQKGATFRNEGKSIYVNWLSPACEACIKGVGSVTTYISLMCHRNCYYCFNPNQEDYIYYQEHRRDYLAEIEQLYISGQKITHCALTGGEPLLHKEDTIAFFRRFREKFPSTHTRLYTSGDLLDEETLQELKKADLNEIRFSIKLEDGIEYKKILEKIAMTIEYIPDVMVEMPVIPGTLTEMKELLLELNKLGVSGINLLEFCFPFSNVEEFKKRFFQIKNPPYKVLYNYWYAGGLPVSGSETECLDLLEFALDNKLSLGVHYCSLENKHTGQIYQQNYNQSISDLTYFSPKDYFLKTAKVFGDDIPKVLKKFKNKNITRYSINNDHNFLEFNIKDIPKLKNMDLEIGLSSSIIETREGEKCLRELKIDLVHPETFNFKMI